MARRNNQKKTPHVTPEIQDSAPEAGTGRGDGYWIWIGLVVIILFIAAIRIHLLDVSLERDEGEYAYAGQLILQGIPPYKLVYNMKMPGIYAAYALILAVFGQTHTGIHLGLLCINAATTVMVFLLAKKLFVPLSALGAAGAFAFLSTSQWVQGIFANAEHFVILPALGGILLLMHWSRIQKGAFLLIGAVLLGLAFLMKQHGGAFVVFGGGYLVITEIRRRPFSGRVFIRRIICFLLGVFLPFGLTCLILWWTEVFDKFWFWTVGYAQEYISSVSLSDGLEMLKFWIARMVGTTTLIWILAGIGLTALFWNKQIRAKTGFTLGFLLLSFLAICPGFYFRPHYFVLLLPAISLLAGVAVGSLGDVLRRWQHPKASVIIPVILIGLVLFHTGYQQRQFFFEMSPTLISRINYGRNPFPESLEIARYIKEHSGPQDRIVVLGSEPQIYFYSGRRSVTPYIYTYAMMDKHDFASLMQKEMIADIESKKPKFLILVRVTTSWLASRDSDFTIIDWYPGYLERYYQLCGYIEIGNPEQDTVYVWDEQCLGYQFRPNDWVAVFRRKL
ncbi:MAG: glycosyltransferase family 39 protein [Sedimentisphaerales bacterium]|nr:glycosyltransferase family 39 protein [Sedimentisphaerales bacterium]